MMQVIEQLEERELQLQLLNGSGRPGFSRDLPQGGSAVGFKVASTLGTKVRCMNGLLCMVIRKCGWISEGVLG